MAEGNQNNEELYKTLGYSNTQFDKNVLFIATGALGISFAFIDKIVVLKEAMQKALLYNGWSLLVWTMLLSLFSHFVSIMAIRWAIKHRHQDNKGTIERIWNYSIRMLNVLMLLLLVSGIYQILDFVKVNT
ncbi:MAG: hypothetical protein RIE58_07875 [Vicingaceae bacterium]